MHRYATCLSTSSKYLVLTSSLFYFDAVVLLGPYDKISLERAFVRFILVHYLYA